MAQIDMKPPLLVPCITSTLHNNFILQGRDSHNS